MKLPYLAIKRPVATLTLICLCVVIGVVSLLFTPLDLLPDIQPPVLAVITVFPGSSPQETLNMVTEPVEDRLSVVGGLTKLSSISQESVSLAILQFQWGADMKAAREEVEMNLGLLTLPDGVEQPFVLEFDPTLLPVMELSATGNVSNAELTQWLSQQVRPRLESIPGVATVDFQGQVEEDYFVRLSPAAMKEYGISFDQVTGILGGSLHDLPAGIVELEDRQLRLRFLGHSHEQHALADMIVGFDVDYSALEQQLQGEFNVDLNRALAEALPAERDLEIPTQTIYLRDVIEELDRDELNEIVNIILNPDFLEDYGLTPEDIDDLIDDQLPNEEDEEAENDDENADDDDPEYWVPVPEDIDWEQLLALPVAEVPDFDRWYTRMQQELTRELDQASRELEAALVEMAMAMIVSSQSGQIPGLDDDFPLTPIRLSSIAEIKKDVHATQTISRLNGTPSIGLSVQKEGSANTVAVARQVRAELDRISEEFSVGGTTFSFYYVYDQAADIEDALRDLVQSLLGGAVLAVLVLILFLKDFRTTLFIGAAIPISLLFTFTLLYFAKLTVNIMTMGAMALAAGLLVDNAIVVSENIYRHLQMGKSAAQAALTGTREVAGAILASTLTTVSVFFPVVFVSGLAGELFQEFALTVSFALAASLLVSFTLIPLMASRFLGKSRQMPRLAPPRIYSQALALVLRRPWATLAAVLVFLIVGGVGFTFMGMDLFPAPPEPSFTIDMRLPPGTSLRITNEYLESVENLIGQRPEVDFYDARAGAPQFLGLAVQSGVSNEARMRVVVAEDHVEDIESLIDELRLEVEALNPEAAVTFNRDSLLETAGLESRLELVIQGEDAEIIDHLTDEAMAVLAELDFLSDIQSNRDEVRPEMHVEVNHPLALQKGISIYQVANTLRMAMEGIPVARVEDGDGLYQLMLSYNRDELSSVEDFHTLPIHSAAGGWLELGEVAQFSEAWGPATLPREDRQMVGQISAHYSGIDLGAATDAALEALDSLVLPPGYSIKSAGAFDMMDDAFSELETILIVSAILVYLVMAAQFESFLNPFIIICSIPLALAGSILALLITGNTLSIPALIGAVVLTGILVNDGIIMVDLINQKRLAGSPLLEAVTEGATSRLRPIMMTTITTVLGLFPLALGLGSGSQLQAPMAITIIGGQLVGTLLLLLVIPLLYSLLSRLSKGTWQKPVLVDED
ncbi:MAG: efflux RND transporter permease subunit [Firmicutes bacterium]|nr:efflux RND transporter permease subunit [Bacillota bacterium]